MTNKAIGGLTAAGTLDGTEKLHIEQSGNSRRTTTLDLLKWHKGSDIASATALTLGTDGNYFDVTGTTTITSINTSTLKLVKLHFDAALTLTHHATDLVLPGGANITTAAGDEAEFFEYADGDWRCTKYQKANGEAVVSSGGGLTWTEKLDQTSVGTGTTVDLTGHLPTGWKQAIIQFNDVSPSTATTLKALLSDDNGTTFETTGYVFPNTIDEIPVTEGSGLDATEEAGICFELVKVDGSEKVWIRSTFQAGSSASDSARVNVRPTVSTGYFNNGNEVDAFRLISSNTFDDGEVSMWVAT